MLSVFGVSISGWLALVLLLGTLTLPYIARHQARVSVGITRSGYYKLLEPHYLIGYVILILTLFHLLVSMSAGMARGANLAGLNIATLAFFLLIVQVMVGRMLREHGKVKFRTGIRRGHFMLMLVIIVLIAIHLEKNSALLAAVLAK